MSGSEAIDVAHLQRQRDWSCKTFGPGPRTAGVIDHIRKELAEVEADPTDLGEWVDVVILALDGAWRAGHGPEAIISAIKAKQARNEARSWPDWRTAPADRAIEHDRSDDAPATPPAVLGGLAADINEHVELEAAAREAVARWLAGGRDGWRVWLDDADELLALPQVRALTVQRNEREPAPDVNSGAPSSREDQDPALPAVLADVATEVERQDGVPGIRTPIPPTRADGVHLAAQWVRGVLAIDPLFDPGPQCPERHPSGDGRRCLHMGLCAHGHIDSQARPW